MESKGQDCLTECVEHSALCRDSQLPRQFLLPMIAPQEQMIDQGGIELEIHSVFGIAEQMRHVQRVFEPFKKTFDLPPVAIDGGDLLSSQIRPIGQKIQERVVLRTASRQQAEERRGLASPTTEANRLIMKHREIAVSQWLTEQLFDDSQVGLLM